MESLHNLVMGEVYFANISPSNKEKVLYLGWNKKGSQKIHVLAHRGGPNESGLIGFTDYDFKLEGNKLYLTRKFTPFWPITKSQKEYLKELLNKYNL